LCESEITLIAVWLVILILPQFLAHMDHRHQCKDVPNYAVLTVNSSDYANSG